jgi:hypothetical protein
MVWQPGMDQIVRDGQGGAMVVIVFKFFSLG